MTDGFEMRPSIKLLHNAFVDTTSIAQKCCLLQIKKRLKVEILRNVIKML